MSAAYVIDGLHVRIKEMQGPTAPRPLPSESGFTEGEIYPVLGAIEHSSCGELWLILPNQENMIYRLSNRHVRYVPTSEAYPHWIHPDLRKQMKDQGT